MRCVAPHVALVPLRSEPSSRAEQVSEVWCGERLAVLEERVAQGDTWLMVRGPDAYCGWLPGRRVSPVGQDWPGEAPIRVGARLVTLVDPADGRGLRSLYYGAIAQRLSSAEAGHLVALSDGTRGTLPSDVERPFYESQVLGRLFGLIEALLGVPYRWGGRSVVGFDCSGFTQFVAREFGIPLPRDASLQEAFARERGHAVDGERVGRGDLLFWGEGAVATHVGIAIDAERFVHARDWVRYGFRHAGADQDLEPRFRGGWRLAGLPE